ncbi:MAG TPA: hypothetical protein VFS33_03155 [Gemmatimonadales bacterium]|nr:hypothetical protein [Gemmatimonadales bacterium]
MRALLPMLCLALATNPLMAQRWTATLAAGGGAGLGHAFDGRSAFTADLGGYRMLSPTSGIGLELGHSRFSSLVSELTDPYGPGTSQREAVRRELWHLAFVGRIRAGGGPWRPSIGGGAGAYMARLVDRIVAHDAAGSEIPQYRFAETTTATRPGLTAFVELVRARAMGSVGVGLQGRWHGIFDLGAVANFVSIGIAFSLD